MEVAARAIWVIRFRGSRVQRIRLKTALALQNHGEPSRGLKSAMVAAS
jgi:hypothetical protein